MSRCKQRPILMAVLLLPWTVFAAAVLFSDAVFTACVEGLIRGSRALARLLRCDSRKGR